MTVSWFTPLCLSFCARKANWNCYQDEERKGVLAEIGLGRTACRAKQEGLKSGRDETNPIDYSPAGSSCRRSCSPLSLSRGGEISIENKKKKRRVILAGWAPGFFFFPLIRKSRRVRKKEAEEWRGSSSKTGALSFCWRRHKHSLRERERNSEWVVVYVCVRRIYIWDSNY